MALVAQVSSFKSRRAAEEPLLSSYFTAKARGDTCGATLPPIHTRAGPQLCQKHIHQSTKNYFCFGQELSKSSIEEDFRDTEQLRQRNCWKLWQHRGLTVEEISYVLHMRQDTIINIILSFERKRGDVDWHRLCKLVRLTAMTAQAILVGRVKARKETSSSCGATLISASDIKNFCPQNVTHSQINLIHVMLERGLTSSEILHIANFTIANEATDLVTEGTCQAQNTSIASMSTGEKVRSAGSTVYDGERNDGEDKESVGFVNPILATRCLEHALITMHEEYADAFLAASMGANDRRLASQVCQEERDTAAIRNMTYDSQGGEHLCQGSVLKQHKLSSLDAEGQETEALEDSPSPITNVMGQKSVMMLDIIEWLQNNDMATLSDIVSAFGYCEAKHLLFLLLELLESSIVVEDQGVLKIPSEQSANRLEVPRRTQLKAFSNPSIGMRMHRALCLKAVVLNVVIHEPKRNVEFMIRSTKPCNRLSNVYHVHIFKCPSCTCPDFVFTVEAGLDYIPCKHLLYVYMVQLGLEKDSEHLMLQKVLKEVDLERILEGHY